MTDLLEGVLQCSVLSCFQYSEWQWQTYLRGSYSVLQCLVMLSIQWMTMTDLLEGVLQCTCSQYSELQWQTYLRGSYSALQCLGMLSIQWLTMTDLLEGVLQCSVLSCFQYSDWQWQTYLRGSYNVVFCHAFNTVNDNDRLSWRGLTVYCSVLSCFQYSEWQWQTYLRRSYSILQFLVMLSIQWMTMTDLLEGVLLVAVYALGIAVPVTPPSLVHQGRLQVRVTRTGIVCHHTKYLHKYTTIKYCLSFF